MILDTCALLWVAQGGGALSTAALQRIDTAPVVYISAISGFESSIIRERTRAGLAAARARGRTGGRPPALSDADKTAARALLKDPAITVEDVAKRLRVSPATLYRHFPGGRSGVAETMR